MLRLQAPLSHLQWKKITKKIICWSFWKVNYSEIYVATYWFLKQFILAFFMGILNLASISALYYALLYYDYFYSFRYCYYNVGVPNINVRMRSCFISTQYRHLKIATTDGDTIFSTNRTLLFFIACPLMSIKF